MFGFVLGTFVLTLARCFAFGAIADGCAYCRRWLRCLSFESMPNLCRTVASPSPQTAAHNNNINNNINDNINTGGHGASKSNTSLTMASS